VRVLLAIIALCPLVHGQTFKSTVEQVAVPITIHRAPGNPGLDFGPEDFRVFDDGRPVPIVSFGKVRQSVHVLLLLDTSRSMIESQSQVGSAAGRVIAHLQPHDSIQIGTFSSVLRLSPAFSADDSNLATRVPVVPGGNMTILYDALLEGCSTFTNEMERRAIFVVSDGMDTASSASAVSVMHRAAESNVAIYAVGLAGRTTQRGNAVAQAPDSVLRTIAEDTGGRYVFGGTEGDFPNLLGTIMEELHQQYIVGFTPAVTDGRLHSLFVTTRRPNTGVRARKHYWPPLRW
jgi:VWFA-related protein